MLTKAAAFDEAALQVSAPPPVKILQTHTHTCTRMHARPAGCAESDSRGTFRMLKAATTLGDQKQAGGTRV